MATEDPRNLAAMADKWASAIAQARAQHAIVVLHGYCRNPRCQVRQVDLRVKDHDRVFVPDVTRHGVRCPVCGQPLACHHVATAVEQERADAREARCSVNTQRYERDHGPLIPGDVFLDDRLPDEPYEKPR
jgi:hypothetical protein